MLSRCSLPEMKEIWQDEYRYQLWLEIELAICEAYVKLGAMSEETIERIKDNAKYKTSHISCTEGNVVHEFHLFLEEVSSKLDEDGQFFHRGVSVSDITDTALSIQLTRSGILILHELNKLMGNIERQIVTNKDSVMVGRTHGMHAEPINLAFKLAVWLSELERRRERLLQAIECIRVGKVSGVVGTYAHIDPEVETIVCNQFGLRSAVITTQIIQRDRHADFICALSLLGGSLEKIALEIRHLQRTEIQELEEPEINVDMVSPSLPHKRNPIFCEQICGLARLLRSYALAAMENIPLWHERDFSHYSVESFIFPESCLVLHWMLHYLSEIFAGLIVHPENMLRNLARSKGMIFSGQILIKLMEKGMSRSKAYKLIHKMASKNEEENSTFKDSLLKHKEVRALLSKEEIEAVFDIDIYLKKLPLIFKRVGV